MSLDRKILERIERENLSIKPGWFFAMKDMFFGLGTFFLSIFSSLSLALLFEIIKQQGQSLTWLNIPYAWVILLGFFLTTGYWLVTRIDSLYRIKFVPIVSMLFFISLSFGYLTFASGKAEKIELELEKIPIYDAIMPIKKESSLDAVEKAESGNENMNVNDENKKNDDDSKEDVESAGSDEDDKVNIQESDLKTEIKGEDEDDETEESEKTDNIDKDDEDSDDSTRGEVEGISREVVKEENEEDDIEEEESDSDDEVASLGEDSPEKSEFDVSDAVDED